MATLRPNGTQQISASWQGITSTGRLLTEARLHASLLPRTSGDSLTITIDVLLSDPLHPTLSDTFSRAKNPKAFEASPKASLEEIFGPRYVPKPFLGLGALGHLLFDIIGSLWGPVGETLSTSILDQPLEPHSALDLTVFSIPTYIETPGLDKRIDFGAAQLIPGNTPGIWTYLGSIYPDREFFTVPAQADAVDNLLIQLIMDNGFQNVPQEVTSWTERLT